jgi:hypothetical protein
MKNHRSIISLLPIADLRHGLRQFTGPCGGIRSQEAAITKTAEAFVEAFQKGDAKAVSFRRSTE